MFGRSRCWLDTLDVREPLSIFSNPRASAHSTSPERAGELDSCLETSSGKQRTTKPLEPRVRLRVQSRTPASASLTSLHQLAGHEEGRGARGAVVVHVHDGDARQAQAVVDGPLTAGGVPWREGALS